jgi:tetratricopeptide (TPR) repeat protein
MSNRETEKLQLEAQRASEQGDTLRALTAADELLKRDPNNVDAMFIAGTAMLLSAKEGVGALILNAARCATKDPVKLGPIWDNIGCALQEYQPDKAYVAFKKALEYGEGRGTYDNLCNVASQIGRHAEALEFSDKVDKVNPAHNRSFALMHMGRWAEGWAAFSKCAGTEVRPRTDRDYGLPRWDGKRKGKVIIHGEQGVGDEIMFMSMCPPDFDGVIECNPRNEGLFARSFPKARVYGTLLLNALEWPLVEKADWHLEMGGLGEFFGKDPFRRDAFLLPDRARKESYATWLRVSGREHLHHRPHVGIAWTGGTWSTGRGRRTVPFDLIAKKLIEQHPDVTFVNLEYEDRKEELAPYPQVLNPYWATKKGADLDDLAAIVSNLDLVITPTQSVVDLCGGLGVPVWVMTEEHPQWRYATAAGEDRMWFYESAKLFRQRGEDNGKWDRVVNNVTTALHQMKLKQAA